MGTPIRSSHVMDADRLIQHTTQASRRALLVAATVAALAVAAALADRRWRPDLADPAVLTPLLAVVATLVAALGWFVRRETVAHAAALRTFAAAHAETVRLLQHDRLTGLPLRPWLEEQLTRRMADRSRAGGRFAAMEIGIDRLSTINEGVSRAAGDDVLVEYATRLQRYVRQDELVARLDGDRFLVVLTMDDEGRAGVVRAAERLLDVLDEPVESLRFGTLTMSASIGIAMYPEHAVDVEDLLLRTQLALRAAKREGCSFARFFRASMLSTATQTV